MFLIRRSLTRCFSSIHKPPSAFRVKFSPLQEIFHNQSAPIEWENVSKELITSERNVNSSNVDGIIITMCIKEQRLDIAKSYADYIASQSRQLNDASIGKLLRLYYNHQHHEGADKNPIAAADEAQISALCDLVIAKHSMIESSLAENLIHGLCLTKDWMKSVDMLNHIRVLGKPNATTYSCIVTRALDEDNFEVAWSLLDQMVSEQLAPRTKVFLTYFEKFKHNSAETEKMLDVIGENSFVLPERRIEDFKEAFGQSVEVVNIKRNGKCPSCSNKLPSNQLNETEFEKLSKTFLEDVMIRSDVYLKTSPGELRRFKDFVDKTAPYDCVIDGLNVAYSHGAQQPQLLAKNVASVVKYFNDRNQSCLVIGRKHMNSWPRDKIDFIRRHSSFFLADNLSQDDPFLLYAALRSGPNTNIFSRDLMRSHSTLLDSDSKKLFRRWQLQHQYSLITSFENGKILVQEPVDFELQASKVNSHWHVPFTAENHSFTYESFELPSKWLCLKLES